MGSLPVHRAEASSQASRWKYALFGLFVLWGWRQRALDRPAAAPAIDAASKLDLVFTLDVTGSMGAYIDSAKESAAKACSPPERERREREACAC